MPTDDSFSPSWISIYTHWSTRINHKTLLLSHCKLWWNSTRLVNFSFIDKNGIFRHFCSILRAISKKVPINISSWNFGFFISDPKCMKAQVCLALLKKSEIMGHPNVLSLKNLISKKKKKSYFKSKELLHLVDNFICFILQFTRSQLVQNWENEKNFAECCLCWRRKNYLTLVYRCLR